MKRVLGIALLFLSQPLWAEWLSVDGQPAKWGDVIAIHLKDIHPTQPGLGFDRIFYKLGRYARDRRKVFDEYCEKNGQQGIQDFSPASNVHDPQSFVCLEKVGTDRDSMKTVVIAPNNQLYLTDGHHTFNVFWHMNGGGPELPMHVVVSRDYRNLTSMDEFWKQMQVEKNIWLFDVNDQPITVDKLPGVLGLENFQNDPYRSLMYFARRIAWRSPGEKEVPDPKFYGDDYPDVPFVEFYWVREIRNQVDLKKFNLNTIDGYADAIRAMGAAIIAAQTKDLGGSGKSTQEMGQFTYFNEKELARISRPGTGKLAYMLKFRNSKDAKPFLRR